MPIKLFKLHDQVKFKLELTDPTAKQVYYLNKYKVKMKNELMQDFVEFQDLIRLGENFQPQLAKFIFQLSMSIIGNTISVQVIVTTSLTPTLRMLQTSKIKGSLGYY